MCRNILRVLYKVMVSWTSKRRSVTSWLDWPHLRTKCLEWIQILAPVISQVVIIYFREKCSLIYCFLSGIAAHGYYHVNYLDSTKLLGHYNDFYSMALKVVDVSVLSFA
jgi:hypothetical protein